MTRIIRYPMLGLASLALALPIPTATLAQSGAGAVVTFVMPAGNFGSKNFTDLIVNTLGAARQFCSVLDRSYQTDCLADRLNKMADDIPEDSDYAEVRQVLAQASREMTDLTRRNRDITQPRKTASSGGDSTRPLTPVSANALASVNAEATAILDRTQTLLLRSPDDEGGKKLHYARIAEAIGSNKTLLRST
jgi:hypothetical protein